MNTSHLTEMEASTAAEDNLGGFCFPCADNHPLYKYGVYYVNLYLTPLILLFGTISNIVTLIVLRSRYYSSSPTCVGLSALAVADICVVLIRGIHQRLNRAYGINLELFSNSMCKIITFAVHLGEQLSGMLLAVTTLEWVIAVWFPLKIREWVTKKRMIAICISIFVLVVILYSALLETNSLDSYYIFKFCGWNNLTAMTVDWWIDVSLTCLVEIPIVLTGNVLILYKLVCSAKKREKEMNASSWQLNNSAVVMLICVGFLFVITTTPRRIYILGMNYNIWYETPTSSETFYVKIRILLNLFYILPIFGRAINFVAYCVSGHRFRFAVKSVFYLNIGKKRSQMSTKYTNDRSLNSSIKIQKHRTKTNGPTCLERNWNCIYFLFYI